MKKRFLTVIMAMTMMLTLIPSTQVMAATEQFTLPVGETYYFDLSSEAANIGTINTALPDDTLHYVPFTYTGTINAYSLTNASSGNTSASTTASQNPSDRSLFVADYNISSYIRWYTLAGLNTNGTGTMPEENLIFGKPFDTNYTLRALSAGSNTADIATSNGGTPTNNEWDVILGKNSAYIKNWTDISSWGQDTDASRDGNRVLRGHESANYWSYTGASAPSDARGFRPALEVLNPNTLGANGLKAITLNLNGGSFNSEDSINIVSAGDSYTAPPAKGLTRPAGNTGTFFVWNTQADGRGTNYAPGASVPSTVTTLYARWQVEEQFSLPVEQTYYFDLSDEAGNIGTINTALPDDTLHYVPFTYTGTINAYSLDSTSRGDTSASTTASANTTDRSLFVADYNVSHSVSWDALHNNGTNSLIFGKTYDTNYTLRSLSAGSDTFNSVTNLGGTPTNNEWDAISGKNSAYIQNTGSTSNPSGSWGQDTTTSAVQSLYAVRGYSSAATWGFATGNESNQTIGWRPALEVLNPDTLGKDGLKTITLQLNGGHLGDDTTITSMNMVYTSASYTAPDATSLTRPAGNTGTYLAWNTQANGNGTTYAPGESVPNTVTTLYAMWIEEQFNLPVGETYYFDLSSEAANIGTINMALPDETLNYVPFTYTGTVNAYSLTNASSGSIFSSAAASTTTDEGAQYGYTYDHSLFVADYNVSHTISWNMLNNSGLIFGKTYDTNYTLRSLSAGSNTNTPNPGGNPTNNEWDTLLGKTGLENPIKNIVSGLYSLGQDTYAGQGDHVAMRGDLSTDYWTHNDGGGELANYGFRPVLEVINPTALGTDGLKTIKLNLNGGHLGDDTTITSMNMIYTGTSYTAPDSTSLTRPAGNSETFFAWNTSENGSGTIYAPGESVPSTVTALFAMWIDEQFNLPMGETYYFDLSNEAANIGTINTALPDDTLHYVPFTYTGTVNTYSLNNASSGDRNASTTASATPTYRSLFVADYNVSHTVSWNKLSGLNDDGSGTMPSENLIFGKPYDTNYTLRSLSAGSDTNAPNPGGNPTNNEWDVILGKNGGYIQNWSGIFSWGQDTYIDSARAARGSSSANAWVNTYGYNRMSDLGFRPALEVLNPDTLGINGLNAIALNLNGGSFNSENSINIVSEADSYTAPPAEGLTRPAGNTGTYLAWNTQANGSGRTYEPGAIVPSTVTTLYAQWTENVSAPTPTPNTTFNPAISPLTGVYN